MKGGPRIKRTIIGQCMAADCPRPVRAGNLCGKHHIKWVLSREPKYHLDRNKRSFRRDAIAMDMNQLTGLPVLKCHEIIRIILDTIKTSIKRGEEVEIPGFGYFGKHKFNKFIVGRSVYFWPSKELREMLNP